MTNEEALRAGAILVDALGNRWKLWEGVCCPFIGSTRIPSVWFDIEQICNCPVYEIVFIDWTDAVNRSIQEVLDENS